MREDTTEPDFEYELRDLLLRAFAEGKAVSGDWTISSVPDRIPDWQVTVERRDGEKAASQSEVVEERGEVVQESD